MFTWPEDRPPEDGTLSAPDDVHVSTDGWPSSLSVVGRNTVDLAVECPSRSHLPVLCGGPA